MGGDIKKIKEIFVVDASFILAFLLKEKLPTVDDFFIKYKVGNFRFVSTSFLKFEVGNGIRNAVLRKRLLKKDAINLYGAFFDLEIIEEEFNYQYALTVALDRNLSFYEASYIALAKEVGSKLLTLDTTMEI